MNDKTKDSKELYVPPIVEEPIAPLAVPVVVLAVIFAGLYVVLGTTVGGVVVAAGEIGGVVQVGVSVYNG